MIINFYFKKLTFWFHLVSCTRPR